MEKQKHILSMLLFVVSCLFSTHAFAYDAEIDGIYYNFNGDEAEVAGSVSAFPGDIIIPESVIYNEQTYSVTSIRRQAFLVCTGLASVTIPKSVTSIGNSAFRGCTGLTSVTLNSNAIASKSYSSDSSLGNIFGQQVNTYVFGEDVTSIGSSAFYGCSGLTSVTIPNSVTSIGSSAFYGCSGLTSVTIPNSVTSIGNSAFRGCTGLTSVIIPNSITSIGDYAFRDCSGLTSVTIGNSVTSIGRGTFYDCSSLKKIIIPDIAAWCGIEFGNDNANPLYYAKHLYSDETTEITNLVIPNSVTSIGDYTFYNCSGLTSVTIPNSVTSIGDDAFSGCNGLKKVIVPDIAAWCGIAFGNEYANPLYYANRLYYNETTEITNLIIPNSVTSIGKYTFSYCSGLTSVTIPNSVTSIENSAFNGCSGLTSVNIPKSVTNIGGGAFYGCDGLTSVTIPNSVTSIGNSAFSGCSGLTSVTIGNSVTSIGSYAFEDCTSLTSVTIPNSVTSMEKYAFYNCSGLTSVTIPNSVTSIGDDAFNGCNGLKKVIVPDIAAWCGIAFGNEYANPLYYANRLYYNETTEITNLIIPNSVTSIGKYTFSYCSGLTSVTIPNSVTSIGDRAFYQCCFIKESFVNNSSLISDSYWGAIICELETTDGLLIHNNEIVKCRPWVTSVTIPNSVTSIGRYAFTNCSGLTSVAIPNSVIGIRYHAFSGCTGLSSITIPNSVIRIEGRAFSYCSGLTSVTIPNSVITIENGAFYECSGLVEVTLNSESVVSANRASAVDALYYVFGEQVKTYIIGDEVINIGDYAFNGCSGLTSVTIPNSVTSIGDGAFADCTGLKKVIVPDIAAWCNITFQVNSYYSTNPLYYAGHLYSDETTEITNLIIPNSVTSIEKYAFYNCSGLTSITIPNSVTSIEKYAFYNCSGLTSITIPNSVTSIGDRAFAGCMLENILLKSNTPPTLIGDGFTYQTYYHGMLYVPTDCWKTYAYDGSWYRFINIRETVTAKEEVLMQQAYTLMDANTFTYSVYDPVNNGIGTISSVGINEDNPNHSWQVITDGSKQYLYNLGAKKFATNGADGRLVLTAEPTPIDMKNGDNGIVLGSQAARQWALVGNDRLSVEQDIITGIDEIANTQQGESISYDLQGRRIGKPQQGINIIRNADGTTKKVLMR